jgi:hypothetical protein
MKTQNESKALYWGDNFIQMKVQSCLPGIIEVELTNLSDDLLYPQLSLHFSDPDSIRIWPLCKQVTLLAGQSCSSYFFYRSSRNHIGIVNLLFYTPDAKIRIENVTIEIPSNPNYQQIPFEKISEKLVHSSLTLDSNFSSLLPQLCFHGEYQFITVNTGWFSPNPLILIRADQSPRIDLYGENLDVISAFQNHLSQIIQMRPNTMLYFQLGVKITKLYDLLDIEWDNITDIIRLASEIRGLMANLNMPTILIDSIIEILSNTAKLSSLPENLRINLMQNYHKIIDLIS